MEKTVLSLLQAAPSEAVALAAPGREAMRYGALRAFVKRIHRQLAARNIVQGDRVAIVLPNGPEMASAFLAVASAVSAAPLNPAYKEAEYDFYLSDLMPKLVLVEKGSDNPVRAAAARLGIGVAELQVGQDDPAGSFSLWPEEAECIPPGAETRAGFEAFVLNR